MRFVFLLLLGLAGCVPRPTPEERCAALIEGQASAVCFVRELETGSQLVARSYVTSQPIPCTRNQNQYTCPVPGASPELAIGLTLRPDGSLSEGLVSEGGQCTLGSSFEAQFLPEHGSFVCDAQRLCTVQTASSLSAPIYLCSSPGVEDQNQTPVRQALILRSVRVQLP